MQTKPYMAQMVFDLWLVGGSPYPYLKGVIIRSSSQGDEA